MVESFDINTNDYWNKRFEDNWESCDGPAQSRFFSKIAMKNLPTWLFEVIKKHDLTVVDWGCAQGDGTDELGKYIPCEQITGVDFSQVAIQQASQRYSNIRFENENWLVSEIYDRKKNDILFSSNTLEHFYNPFDILNVLSKHVTKAIILAIPYNDDLLISEHFFRFDASNIPLILENGWTLLWAKVVDCKKEENTQWPAEQIILLYVDNTWLSSLGLCLKQAEINCTDYYNQLNQAKKLEQILTNSIDLVEQERDSIKLEYAAAKQERDSIKLEYTAAKQEYHSLEKTTLEYLNKIQVLEKNLVDIKSSKSWLLTRPFRFTRIFINNPIVALYQLAKFIYWRLPLPFRQSLHGVKDKVTRQFKGKIVAQSVGDKADLSWDDFAQNVLLNRNNYKGVFVQELVIDWNVPLYQRPQHLATALGRLGYLVIYKTDNWAGDNVNGFREVEKNVWLTNQIHHVDTINGVVRSFYSTAYANTPQTLLKNDKRGMLIYEYIDHIDPQISGDAENIQRLLALKDLACTSDVDFVVASARKLEEEMVSLVGKTKVISIPNGVDTRHYRNPIHKKMPLPDNVVQFRKKYTNIVGYFGALAPWLWYDLINDLVKSRPDLGFVFIGPDYYGGLAKLPKAENVLYLGVVDYKILPAYAHTFDVCFIPFALGEIAKTTSPLKLFEYFALMKPVVVTSDMQECIQFQEVFSGGDVSSISQAIDKAIVIKKDHEFCQKLSNLADQNDWDKRAQELEVVFQALKDGILSENRN